jgi:NAD-dependent deacetylase
VSTLRPLELGSYPNIVVFTGAGISVASGLPTYRGVGGIWERDDVETHATAAALAADPHRVWAFFTQARRQIAEAKPSAGHLAIARAEEHLRRGQTLTVITQNVDGLHSLAGSKKVVELHGTLRRSRCMRCDHSRDEELETSPEVCPACPSCGAPMRPAVVLFDEMLPVDAERSAKKALHDCDLFIGVGTSGTVAPASNFVRAAEYAGARTIYVNLEPMAPHNPSFHVVHLGRAEEVLPILLGA